MAGTLVVVVVADILVVEMVQEVLVLVVQVLAVLVLVVQVLVVGVEAWVVLAGHSHRAKKDLIISEIINFVRFSTSTWGTADDSLDLFTLSLIKF